MSYETKAELMERLHSNGGKPVKTVVAQNFPHLTRRQRRQLHRDALKRRGDALTRINHPRAQQCAGPCKRATLSTCADCRHCSACCKCGNPSRARVVTPA